MKIKIKRIEKDLPLPKYESKGAVGFDFIAREDTVIQPKQIGLIPSNNIIETPPGYALVVAPRSSMPRKTGLSFPHSIGIVDQDYCGSEDEVLIQVYNFTDHPVEIQRGDKIAQGVFIPVVIADWNEVESMNHNKTRGGFGSTGGHKK